MKPTAQDLLDYVVMRLAEGGSWLAMDDAEEMAAEIIAVVQGKRPIPEDEWDFNQRFRDREVRRERQL